MPTISVSLLKAHIRAYEILFEPFDYNVLNEVFGVTSGDLENDDNRVPIAVTNYMLEKVSAATNDPILGLKWREITAPPVRPALTRCIASAPNIHSAFQIALRFLRLITEVGDFAIEVSERRAHLVFEPYDCEAVSYHQVDAIMLTLARFAEQLGGNGLLEVHLAHSCAEGYEKDYTNAFKTQVLFSQKNSGFILDGEWLKRPLNPDPINIEDLVSNEKQCARLDPTHRFPSQVMNTIKLLLIYGEPSREQLAKAWGMSLRNFQRKLREFNTNFQELLNEARMQQAKEYLSQGIYSCEDIAFLLGYSDVRPFYLAFKRWTGYSPGSYRKP